jgi:hypothetical protein
MSSNDELQKVLGDVVNVVKSNTHVNNDIVDNNILVVEIINNIYQQVCDLNRKFDAVLNIGVKKPRSTTLTPKTSDKPSKVESKSPPKKKKNSVINTEVSVSTIKKVQSKPIKNIMTYFKTKYQEDNTLFSNILEENQAESVFEQNKSVIALKKEGVLREKSKATLLYKTLTDAQKSKIRDIMVNEHERSNLNNSDELAEESD